MGTPASPTTSHTDVTPCSRSARTALRATAGSGCACRCRTSQPLVTPPSGRPPRTKGAKPGIPPVYGAVYGVVYGAVYGDSPVILLVYKGYTRMPSYVRVASSSETSSG